MQLYYISFPYNTINETICKHFLPVILNCTQENGHTKFCQVNRNPEKWTGKYCGVTIDAGHYGGTGMSHTLFSKEEIDLLKQNRYVLAVSRKRLRYSGDFYEYMAVQYKSGIMPYEALEEIGIDPKILGDSRIYGIKTRVIQMMRDRGEDVSLENKVQRAGSILSKVDLLEHKVKYLEQQQEFFKKILAAADEAAKK
jgi:hypothetical protein